MNAVFDVVYADPPWRYENGTPGREVENHYPTMTHDEICAVQVPAARNAVLFLWAVAPKLPEALDVMSSWGFTYRSGAVWDKDIVGMGYWFRGQHEHLLVGVKGQWSPPPAVTARLFGSPRAAGSPQQEARPHPCADRCLVARRATPRDVLPLPLARLVRLGQPGRLVACA